MRSLITPAPAEEVSMAVAAAQRTLPERALEVLRRAGNPFRNYFARNPDDEVCARYHVPELFATEREQLLGVRSEEHTSELQSRQYLVCRLLLEKKKKVS